MPFDGIVTKSIVLELSDLLINGRIEKIYQPEADEIILNLRAKGQNVKLLLSASANYPRIHLTAAVKENPATPPVFCMLLRKHLAGGKITYVEFFDYERIVALHIESVNEMGDLTHKKLIIEIMGRHSNIILVNEQDKILDSIKHVDHEISSVREVMPARPYVLPPSQNKINPDLLEMDRFITNACMENIAIEKYLLNAIRGFSPLICREICHQAGVDGKIPFSDISLSMCNELKICLEKVLTQIKNGEFAPCIGYADEKKKNPIDYHCLPLLQYEWISSASSISQVLDLFYSSKDKFERLKQKKADVQKVLHNSLDRCNKKLSLQQDKLREVSDREKLKLYGELITANIYRMSTNCNTVSLHNYYSENEEYVDIPLNEHLTPQENAQSYFKQYAKAKSAYAFTSKQVEETLKELDYLESVSQVLDGCETLQEIDEIRQELSEQGYLAGKRKTSGKLKEKSLKPLMFKSSDGLDIFVGKNNKQNDQLTLKMASSNDLWLHTRNIPGSHVVIRKQQYDIPDRTLLEAAILAAYHSKAKMSSNVPVDYTTVKNVKKPAGAKPGMVIYENFKTLIVTPEENEVKKIQIEKQK